MAGLLWIVAAAMELAAVGAYYLSGVGVGFVTLELFVLASLALTIYQVRERGGRGRHPYF